MQQTKMPMKALSLKKKVTYFALWTRIFLVALSCISNNLIPDHNADAFVSPANPYEKNCTFCDNIVDFVFGGLIRWDAQYFLHIARYGYTFENCLAFFPLYPLVTCLVSNILYVPLSIILSWSSITVLSAVIVNLYFFIKAAEVLYDLTEKVLRDHQLAYAASVMFCVNPASIFFVAPYSETLFSFLTFFGMLMCVSNFDILCSVPLGISASVRSNGILNAWFPLFKITNVILPTSSKKLKPDINFDKRTDMPWSSALFIDIFLKIALTTTISLAPFVAFQVYCYCSYCGVGAYDIPAFLASFAHEQDLVIPGSRYLSWCDNKMTLPYMYVQQHYWNVGFLRYYEFKQIPNFMLAAPILFLVFMITFCFIRLHTDFNLPFLDLKVESISGMPLSIFPFIIHAAGLSTFCVLNIHIQVTTRLIASSSPVLYWFAAYVMTGKLQISNELIKNQDKKSVPQKNHRLTDFDPKAENWWNILFVTPEIPLKRFSTFIRLFFLSYLVIGTVLFSNFYPWT